MLDLIHDLNERQLEAAQNVDGPLLVIAGAGSGKTRVITYRVANLVQNHGIKPWRILAVTFTNKAAKEMRERVVALLGGGGEDCWVSTFHSTCAKLLRIHGDLIGIKKQFTIYDDSDQKAMVARCLKELNLSEKRFPPRAIQNEINRAKRELVAADEYPTSDFYREQIQQIYQLYEKRMNDASALDFGDLLYRMVRGLRENEDLAAAVSGRFDYVLVDEFQDTNFVQLELIRQLAKQHGNVCVVGDDDQSIYSWRGADVTNILEFEKHFPGAAAVTLDRNYRSTANILGAAHGVVSKLKGRRDKELWTKSAAGDQVALIEAEDEREEARLVSRAVRELADDGFTIGKQAVFYRINAQSRVFEEVFRTMGIPYRVVGGMRFYERAEVKDVLAYLRLIQNPGDLAALLRIINTPTRGIGKTTVDKLVAIAAGNGISAYEAIDRAAESIGKAGIKRLKAFCDLVEGWRAEIDHGPLFLAERVLDDTGYLTGLQAQNSAEADARIENLKELVGSIGDFESEAETPTLASFLELVALQTDVDQANFDGEEVTLMTVHSAKGLEFDVVHVTGLEEELFPYRAAGDDLFESSEEEMAEERRLCYVAMTRARKRLFLTRARVRRLFGRSRMPLPSRFLSDIPQDLLADLTPERPRVQRLGALGSNRYSGASSGYGSTSGIRGRRPEARKAAPSKKTPSNKTWVDRSFDQSVEGVSLQPGQKVRNVRYGVGEVVSIRPGSRPKVEVIFPVYGKKVIIIDYLEID
ncbi:MAG: UvrD-helicase domain-containing protein [Deltaproteobacteria bacterium]|nr:UvrD-helicase domain-containing protein [Deltaproteobacteria bacterium]